MLSRLDAALNFYSKAVSLRDTRHKVLASNIANSDTPGYKARDFNFRSALDSALKHSASSHSGGLALARTNSAHIAGRGPGGGLTGGPTLSYRVPDQPSLDGNTVDMNVERVKFVQNSIHYRADQQMLSDSIKALKTAMQPMR